MSKDTGVVGIVGKGIRRLRLKNRWTLTELSNRSGVGISVLSELENGRKKTGREDTLKKIAAAFDVPISELWKEEAV